LHFGARFTFSDNHQHIAGLEQCVAMWNEHLPAAAHAGDHGIPWPGHLPHASAVADRFGL